MAWLEALDEHVRLRNPLEEPCAPCRVVDIEHNAFLARVQVCKTQTFPVSPAERSHASHGITRRGLDLDYLHAKVCEEATAQLALLVRQVYCRVPFEKTRRLD